MIKIKPKKLNTAELISWLQEACYLLDDVKKNQEPETETRIQNMVDCIDESCFRLRNGV